ncbi:YjcZ family sporulation protein [Alkalihalobacillus sp. R86527]|uniref:YjcZ family sporulation protein n=1 Tax=Alkalihalobacillus sp. R86527 TaxID=3093863 RepID=UPI00366E4BB7
MSGGKENVRPAGYGKGFALIVVLFILLIIVGAAAVGGANTGPGPCCYGKGGYGGYGY